MLTGLSVPYRSARKSKWKFRFIIFSIAPLLKLHTRVTENHEFGLRRIRLTLGFRVLGGVP